MKKIPELTGTELNYWVARAVGLSNAKLRRVGPTENGGFVFVEHVQADGNTLYSPSSDWKHGGPIIEREAIELRKHWQRESWSARIDSDRHSLAPMYGYGETPLIAAMRAYVSSKYGDSVPAYTKEPDQ